MDKDVPVLPEDIMWIIAELLDPHMVTLLDKKYRDKYFKKHGLNIEYTPFSCDRLNKSSLKNYKITLYIIYGLYYDSEIIRSNIHRIVAAYINNLGYYINTCPNLSYISGHLKVTDDNLEKLRLIKNDLILEVDLATQLETLRKYPDIPNLINVTYIHRMYNCSLDGLENRIVKAPSYLLKENTEYINIEEIKLDDYIYQHLRKNIRLPRIKKIIARSYILDDDQTNLKKRYPGVIIEEC